MKNAGIYSLIFGLIVFLSACGGKFHAYDLSQEYATSLHYQPAPQDGESKDEAEESSLVGVPAKNFYGGDLKRGGIWWARKGITLEKGDVFIFFANTIGPDSTPFGATFPPIDLVSDKVMIKVSARAEGADGNSPTLYLQVDDAEGYQANAKWPSQKIENSEDFKDYYFDIQDKEVFAQILPKKHKVNGALINSVKFFINPGQTAFTGKIYIKEIKVVPAGTEAK